MKNVKFIEFANEVKEGQKVTILNFNDFGFPATTQTTIKEAFVKSYAQYDNALFIIHKPKRKRTYIRKVFTPNETVLIFDGWHELKTDMFVNSSKTHNAITQNSLPCFDSKYIDIVLQSAKVKPMLANSSTMKFEDDPEEQAKENIYQVVSKSEGTKYYTLEEMKNKYTLNGYNTRTNIRLELQGQPIFKELMGAMWGGVKDNLNVIRYECS